MTERRAWDWEAWLDLGWDEAALCAALGGSRAELAATLRAQPFGSALPELADAPLDLPTALARHAPLRPYVDLATGHVVSPACDVAPGGPLAFELRRVWLSRSTYQGPFGHGWHSRYDTSLHVEQGKVLHRTWDARSHTFPELKERGQTHFDPVLRHAWQRSPRGYQLRTPDGRVERFETKGPGANVLSLSAIEDRSGYRLQLRHDAAGRLQDVVDGAGRTFTFTYDTAGRVVKVSGPHPERSGARVLLAQYGYDARGDLVQVTDALAQVARYRYVRHLLVQQTDRSGASFYFKYTGSDARSRCSHTWAEGGLHERKLAYDDARQITTVEDGLGQKTQYQHERGRLVRMVDANGGSHVFDYDRNERRRATTDALGRTTRYEHDARGNLTALTRADGSRITATYDQADRLSTVEDGGTRFRFVYDLQGRMTERVDAQGGSTRFVYSGRDLVEIVDPGGARFQLGHDAQGNLTELREPSGALRRFHHDHLGRMTKLEDALGNLQQRSYDLLGRVTRVTEPDGNVRELSWDAEGRLVRLKDAQRDIQLGYHPLGMLSVRSEAERSLRLEHDKEGRLSSVRRSEGVTQRFERGPTGAVSVEHLPGGGQRKYRYDLAGQLVELTRANGAVSRYTYDACGRISEVAHSDGERERYTYRADGALLTAANDACEVRFERDVHGRVIREWQDGRWIESHYDEHGRRISMSSSFGAELQLTRDVLGRVVALESERPQLEVSLRRDVAGQELERVLSGGIRSRVRRDKLGRPKSHEVLDAARTLIARSYNWDVNARLTMQIDAEVGPTRYSYDARSRLLAAQYSDGSEELHVPDALGNAYASRDFSDRRYGAGGELLEAVAADGATGVVRYEYDAENNLVEKREASGRSERYFWSAAGRLSFVLRADGSRLQLTYDALGRRVAKQFRGLTTHYTWDGDALLHEWVEGQLEQLERAAHPGPRSHVVEQREAELAALIVQDAAERGSAALPVTWLFEPDSAAPLARLQQGRVSFVLCDYRGVPCAVVDADGRPLWSATLSSYGRLRELRGARAACPFRWPGHYEDLETGLFCARDRYYDPETGQWIGPRPIGVTGVAALGYQRDPLAWVRG